MKAERTVITEEVVTTVSSERIVLTLSPSEAQFLMDVTGYIGGDPLTTRRGIADRLRAALMDCGIDGFLTPSDMDGSRSLYFQKVKANG